MDESAEWSAQRVLRKRASADWKVSSKRHGASSLVVVVGPVLFRAFFFGGGAVVGRHVVFSLKTDVLVRVSGVCFWSVCLTTERRRRNSGPYCGPLQVTTTEVESYNSVLSLYTVVTITINNSVLYDTRRRRIPVLC